MGLYGRKKIKSGTKGVSMSIATGDTVQEQVGRLLAKVRVDNLSLRNRELAKALTTHSGNVITSSRVSEAEHGRTNLNQEYVTLFLAYLHDTNKEAWTVLTENSHFMEDLVPTLPNFSIRHKSNEGSEGNNSHAPKTPAFGVIRKKGTLPPTPVDTPDTRLAITLQHGVLRIGTGDYTLEITSLQALIL